MALHLNALVQLLGQAHSLLGGEIEGLGGLLLHGTGGKGNGSFLDPLALFHLVHHIGAALQIRQDPIQFLLAADARLAVLSVVAAVIFGGQRLLGAL